MLSGCLFAMKAFAVNYENGYQLPQTYISYNQFPVSISDNSLPLGNNSEIPFKDEAKPMLRGYDFGDEELGVEGAPQDAYWVMLFLGVAYVAVRFYNSKKRIGNL